MKRGIKIGAIVVLTFSTLLAAAFFAVKFINVPDIKVENVNLNDIKDGSYPGEYSAGPVKAIVRVHVTDNRIADIIIEQHKNGLGKKAEKVIDAIKYKQSLDVEVVSGATLSSNVIRKAVEEALNKF